MKTYTRPDASKFFDPVTLVSSILQLQPHVLAQMMETNMNNRSGRLPGVSSNVLHQAIWGLQYLSVYYRSGEAYRQIEALRKFLVGVEQGDITNPASVNRNVDRLYDDVLNHIQTWDKETDYELPYAY